MRLVIGLGNPGGRFADTRHNIGWKALDSMAGRWGVGEWTETYGNALVMEADVGGRPVALLKPLTYMNASGEAVSRAVEAMGLGIDDVLVVHDDLDLAPGDVRTKVGGGHGGHNGLRSIDAALGRDYARLRLGIGHPRRLGVPVIPYVLGGFGRAEGPWLAALVDAIGRRLPNLFLRDAAAYVAEIAARVPKVSSRTAVDAAAVDGLRDAWDLGRRSDLAALHALLPFVLSVEAASTASAAAGRIVPDAALALIASLDYAGTTDEGSPLAPMAALVSRLYAGITAEAAAGGGSIEARRRIGDDDLALLSSYASEESRTARRRLVDGFVDRMIALVDEVEDVGPRPGDRMTVWLGPQAARLLVVERVPAPGCVAFDDGTVAARAGAADGLFLLGRRAAPTPYEARPATEGDAALVAAACGRVPDEDPFASVAPPEGASGLVPAAGLPSGWEAVDGLLDPSAVVVDVLGPSFKAEYGVLTAYMTRRFGPANADGDDGKDLCGGWLLSGPDPGMLVRVKPRLSEGAGFLTAWIAGERISGLSELRDAWWRGRLVGSEDPVAKAAYSAAVLEVQRPLRRAFLDLLRPVLVRDVAIDLAGRHGAWLPDGGASHPRRVPPVSASPAATRGVPHGILDVPGLVGLVEAALALPGGAEEALDVIRDAAAERLGPRTS